MKKKENSYLIFIKLGKMIDWFADMLAWLIWKLTSRRNRCDLFIFIIFQNEWYHIPIATVSLALISFPADE